MAKNTGLGSRAGGPLPPRDLADSSRRRRRRADAIQSFGDRGGWLWVVIGLFIAVVIVGSILSALP